MCVSHTVAGVKCPSPGCESRGQRAITVQGLASHLQYAQRHAQSLSQTVCCFLCPFLAQLPLHSPRVCSKRDPCLSFLWLSRFSHDLLSVRLSLSLFPLSRASRTPALELLLARARSIPISISNSANTTRT